MQRADISERASSAWAAWQMDLSNHEKFIKYLENIDAFDDASIDHAKSLFRHHVTNDMALLRRWRDVFPARPKRSSRYLDLLERTVCNWIYKDSNITLSRNAPFDEARRQAGRDIPQLGHSMIGRVRLAHLRWAVEEVISQRIPGDLLEAGVWRGGACILMRGVLAEYEVSDRAVLVADSFEGLPPPDPRYPEDALSTFDFHLRPELAISLDVVRQNFERYGLLDDQVIFVKGFFEDTLPRVADRPLAILRLDGDLFSSTMDALVALYDSVSPGGLVIIDDYGSVIDCKRAVAEFRIRHNICQEMFAIDDDGVFWIK